MHLASIAGDMTDFFGNIHPTNASFLYIIGAKNRSLCHQSQQAEVEVKFPAPRLKLANIASFCGQFLTFCGIFPRKKNRFLRDLDLDVPENIV